MTEGNPTIEYSPTLLEGNFEYRKTDFGATISLRPTTSSIVRKLSFQISVTLAAALFILLITLANGPSGSKWPHVVGPAIIVALGIWSCVSTIIPILHPIMFEVNPDDLSISWRTLTEAKFQKWSRDEIVDVRARKIRLQNQFVLRKWALVCRMRSGGELAIYLGKRHQLEVIARFLREALGVQDINARAVPTPPRDSRFKVQPWRDGSAIWMPPPHAHWVWKGLLFAWSLVAAGVYAYMWLQPADDAMYTPALVRQSAMIALILCGAGFGYAITWNGSRKLMRYLVVSAGPSFVSVAESSLFHPVAVSWKAQDIADITVAAENDAIGSLRFIPRHGVPLIVAQGRPLHQLHWVVATLKAAQSPIDCTGQSSALPIA